MSDTRLAHLGKRDKSGGSRRHVGGTRVRWLSRGIEVESSDRPYKSCMLLISFDASPLASVS